MIDAHVNPLTGHPFVPSRQLCASWVVSAWERVPESLVRKAWVVGNYMTSEESQKQRSYESLSNEIVNYDQNKIIGAITQETNNEDLLQHCLAADNTCAMVRQVHF